VAGHRKISIRRSRTAVQCGSTGSRLAPNRTLHGDRRPRTVRDTDGVILSRNWSVFLVLAGAFNWVIWPRFAAAIWNDQRAWSGEIGRSSPTSFLLVHAVLISTAVAIGTVIVVLGARAFLADRRARAARRPALADR
jgi:hypothetical protein